MVGNHSVCLVYVHMLWVCSLEVVLGVLGFINNYHMVFNCLIFTASVQLSTTTEMLDSTSTTDLIDGHCSSVNTFDPSVLHYYEVVESCVLS